MSYYYGWRPYVPVAARRAQAVKKAAQFAKSGRTLSPVKIEGRTIARTFWGKAWCQHLESFSDYENRLPRGRAYARNGSVIDLQIEAGKISALVMGSELYEIRFTISPLKDARWKDIKSRSTGQIDSLVELLQGKFSDAVMRVITDRDAGLFPAPSEIKKSCSCPDSAGLCKHLAAALYGIGARLDEKPELLFLLRGVDHLELLESAPTTAAAAAGTADIASSDLADVFGIEIAAPDGPKKQPKIPAKTRTEKKPTATKVPAKIEPKKKRKPKSPPAGKKPDPVAADTKVSQRKSVVPPPSAKKSSRSAPSRPESASARIERIKSAIKAKARLLRRKRLQKVKRAEAPKKSKRALPGRT